MDYVQTFCFYCGILGHNDRYCAKTLLFDVPRINMHMVQTYELTLDTKRGEWVHIRLITGTLGTSFPRPFYWNWTRNQYGTIGIHYINYDPVAPASGFL